MGATPQLEVGPGVAGGPQKGFGRVPAPTSFLVDLKVAHALVVAAVEVFCSGNAGLHGSLRKGIQHVPAQALFIDPPLAAGIVVAQQVAVQATVFLHQRRRHAARAVRCAGTLVVVFVQHEVGQAVLPAPGCVTYQLTPVVVVAGLAAHVDHAVDAAAAAQCLAARVAQRAAVQPGIGFGVVQPVGAWVANAVQIAHGDVDPVVVVLAAGLYQQHALGCVCAEAVGQQAAGRARTDDDVVKRGFAHAPS